VCQTVNQAGRTPALEALLGNQPSAFALLSRHGDNLGTGEALREALTARRGVVTEALLKELQKSAHSEALLRRHVAAIGRRLAYLGDVTSLAPLLRLYAHVMLSPSKGAASILHRVAQVNGTEVWSLLEAHATAAQLRILAEHQDHNGRLAEQETTEPTLAASWRALRGAHSEPAVPVSPPPPTRFRTGLLRSAVAKVAAQSRSQDLEQSVTAFCNQAERTLAANLHNDELVAHINALAWEVVDHIDRAPTDINIRMGTHLSLHRPDVTLEALQQRATAIKSGASRFALEGGLSLLRGRTAAVEKMRKTAMQPGMRLVIDVSCPGLEGVVVRYTAGKMMTLKHVSTLRTIFAQTPNGPLLVTSYAINIQPAGQ
jgi:hypothetical protein